MSTALEARPSVAVDDAEPRPTPSPAAPDRVWAWVRLGLVALLAAASELLYAAVWPLSYYLTQATSFTYEYLLEYPWVWERMAPALALLEANWPNGIPTLAPLGDSLSWFFLAAFAVYMAAFLLARAGLPSGWGAGLVVGAALAFHATLFLMPGLFTTDLFSYIIYGHIAGVYERNPWTQIPAFFPENPIVGWIHPIWHHAPSIYGPAWIDLALPLARRIAGASEVDKVFAYKLLVNVGHFASVAFLALTVHRLRPGAVTASVLLYAWNPLVVFEFGGNGHNDAVMIAGMLLGVCLFAWGQPAAGLVALTVSFLMKMSSILLVPYYVIAWARQRKSPLEFFGVLCLAGALVAVVVVGFYWPWWVGLETIGPILNWTQGPMFNNYVPDILAFWLAREFYLDPLRLDMTAALEQARADVKQVARVVFAGYCLWELWNARDALGMAGAGARVMLGFLLIVNTWVLPWYFTWPLALAIIVGWESITARVLLGFSLSAPTVMYYHHFWHPYMADSTYILYLAPLAIVPVLWLPRLANRFSGRMSAPSS
jgi:hypothetical protein